MKITYKQVLDLGFKRYDSATDDVFFKQYGFKYFIVSLKINKKYSMEWDVTTHLVTLYKDHNTFQKSLTLDEITNYIKLLK
jgi:hypothetical protein